MSRGARNLSLRFPTRYDTNWTVQPQMTRGLKFLIDEVDGSTIYVVKTKALISCAADLRLCFCICKKQVFSWHGSYVIAVYKNHID